MRRRRLRPSRSGLLGALLAAAVLLGAGGEGPAGALAEEIATGITYRFYTVAGPRRVHVLRADLSAPQVRFRTALAGETVQFAPPERTSSMGERLGALAAVNADYFGAGHHNVEELFVTGGRVIYTPPAPFRSILNITQDHQVHIGMDRAGLAFYNTVGGGPQLVRGGRFVWDTSVPGEINGEGFSPNTKFDGRNPSTAAGLTRDRRTLILLVVDGRQPGFSIGTTPAELADLLLAEGAWEAMRFDGGGSSTMWIRGQGVVNSPSDGSERPVGSAILVYAATREPFLRGDANGDGSADLADAVRILLYLFGGALAPPCPDAADVDDSEAISLPDAVHLLGFLFRGGSPPAPPYPSCGRDPRGSALECGRNPCPPSP